MCGIVAFWDKTGGLATSTGRIVLGMLEALKCRGPDSAGVAIIGPEREVDGDECWFVRVAAGAPPPLERLATKGELVAFEDGSVREHQGDTWRFCFRPARCTTAAEVERALGSGRNTLEVLSLGRRLDLAKQVGSPRRLEAAYGVSSWCGPLAIGHTRMSTESRIDLSHSQPFWAHGVPDLATVHNGHVTNYHQLRRQYEQRGTTFYTDNDSEVIGVYLRDQMEQGQSLAQALASSIHDLDGAFNYLVVSAEGLGIVRDRFGFKPLALVETDDFVAVATEEIALRCALPGDYTVTEPPPATALFYALNAPQPLPV
jgi:methylamine---glutamate N-methyltransferase subunit A